MALLQNYGQLGAAKLKDFAQGVIIGLGSDPIFSSLATAVTALTTANNELADSILPFNQSTKLTNDVMMNNKGLVIKKLDEIRPLANAICDGDGDKERLSGFTPSKKGRSRRTFIAHAFIEAIEATGVPGYLLITLSETVPGNTGYEVHYTLGSHDHLVGIAKVRNRTLQIMVGGFPSLTVISVYLITLSTNGLRSTPSNILPGAAS